MKRFRVSIRIQDTADTDRLGRECTVFRELEKAPTLPEALALFEGFDEAMKPPAGGGTTAAIDSSGAETRLG